MDEKLKQIFRVRSVQAEVILNRSSMPNLRTILKHTLYADIKNSVNVEIDVKEAKLKMPDPKNIPPLTECPFTPLEEFDKRLEDYAGTLHGWNLL